jgi:predicted PurR-regulated permease PerM
LSGEHIILRRVILVVLFTALTVGSLVVLHPFIIPVAWAAVLAYTTWPLHLRLIRGCGGRTWAAAGLMTFLLIIAFVGPLFVFVLLMQSELHRAYEAVMAALQRGPLVLPPAIAKLPVVGGFLQSELDLASQDPAAFAQSLGEWATLRGGEVSLLLGGVGRNAAKFALSLITVFFLYCHGQSLVTQTRLVLHRAIGPRVDHYLAKVGATTRAVVFGLVLTALAQGTLAGLGYAVAGVAAPVLLGALTALLALLPFGAPMVWLPISVWLLLTGEVAAGAGLMVWGFAVVSWVDNLIRPIVISNATDIPFLLVMFGVLGGLAAFGLIGVFLGPVLLAVMLAVWEEWLEEA